VDTKKAIREISEICEARNIKLVFFLWGKNTPEYQCGALFELYGEMLAELEIPFYFFPERIFQKKYQVSLVDVHPNSDAHAIMAGSVFEHIKEDLIPATNTN
jgi:hypothetical protein